MSELPPPPPPPAGANGHGAATNSSAVRPPRLPRWTRQEILVLIEGKRVVEGRGKGRGQSRAGLVGPARPAESKWAAVSAYCRRHGVDRGPVQCRKRWSNLAGDFKKIKEWENNSGGKNESFWAMRNDLRRERRLPGFFDREVYDIIDGAAAAVEKEDAEEEEATDEAVFDSGRTAADDGLFSDSEGDDDDVAAAEEEGPTPIPAEAVRPISERKLETSQQECSDSGTQKGKQPSPENNAPSSAQEAHKRRRRSSQDGYADTSMQNRLIEVLEGSGRMLAAQLEAQNVSNQLDREQRKEQTDGLLCVLSKVADALGRIADKL